MKILLRNVLQKREYHRIDIEIAGGVYTVIEKPAPGHGNHRVRYDLADDAEIVARIRAYEQATTQDGVGYLGGEVAAILSDMSRLLKGATLTLKSNGSASADCVVADDMVVGYIKYATPNDARVAWLTPVRVLSSSFSEHDDMPFIPAMPG